MALDSECTDQAVCGKKKTIRGIHRQYWLFVAGVFLFSGPYIATLALQSSIAIQENIGTLAMGIAFLVGILVTVFIVPFAIIRFGARDVLLFGEAAYLVYIAANCYPKKWIKITAGIIVGAGDALVWPAISVYLWHFGYSHGLVATRAYGVYVRRYSGIFFGILQIGQVLANGVAYGILRGSKTVNQTLEVGPLDHTDENSSLELVDKYQYCGANDCLESNNTEENLNRYVPANQTSLYVLIGVFCCSCILGIGLQACKLKKPKKRRDETEHNEVLLGSDHKTSVPSKKDKTHHWSIILETFKQIIDIQQTLILPMTFYYGLLFTFKTSEFTRAFVSCIVGVEKVGLALVISGIASGLTSVVIPKIVGKIGQPGFLTFVALLDVASYTFCLLWQPSEDKEFLVFILAIFFGISDATWKILSFDCYTRYFPNNTEIAYTMWNCLVTIGLAVGFLCTPLFCVSTKLYILITLVTFSTVGFGLAERRHRQMTKNLEKTTNHTEEDK